MLEQLQSAVNKVWLRNWKKHTRAHRNFTPTTTTPSTEEAKKDHNEDHDKDNDDHKRTRSEEAKRNKEGKQGLYSDLPAKRLSSNHRHQTCPGRGCWSLVGEFVGR